MAFIPHTPADVEAMLAAIGVDSIETLFDEIPASLRVKSLAGIPDELNEMQVGRLMSERARIDGRPLCFIGAGAYEHHIPAAVWAITTRGEFYSAYTPYQAEVSQGRLEALLNFQQVVMDMTGFNLANASKILSACAPSNPMPLSPSVSSANLLPAPSTTRDSMMINGLSTFLENFNALLIRL